MFMPGPRPDQLTMGIAVKTFPCLVLTREYVETGMSTSQLLAGPGSGECGLQSLHGTSWAVCCFGKKVRTAAPITTPAARTITADLASLQLDRRRPTAADLEEIPRPSCEKLLNSMRFVSRPLTLERPCGPQRPYL